MMYRAITVALAALMLAACAPSNLPSCGQPAPISPDYVGVTVPCNIAPLHFTVPEASSVKVVYKAGGKTVKGDGCLSQSAWKKLVKAAADGDIEVTVMAETEAGWKAYEPFSIHISTDEIDPYIAYRLIEPGYEKWNEMGIYQRCLESYRESAIITNRLTNVSCVNCHSFPSRNPSKMLFHSRVECGGTYFIDNGKVEKLNTKTPETISALVYPQWHPSGKYVAFSNNLTKQNFHTTDPNRIEVFDSASDVVVYDVEKHEIVSSPLLKSGSSFETFPTFSPDGRTLYFCTADSIAVPEHYDKVKYSVCSIAFDPDSRSFGPVVDTLYNARTGGLSASFPRISPDGGFLMYTLSGYGNFSIWHKDADLAVASLPDGSPVDVSALNSDDVESYHSWSGNGRWVVFSSRRDDKLYTRLYIAHIDENGVASKPFVVPQKSPWHDADLLKSYNIPEFIEGRVKASAYRISRVAKKDPGVDLTFAD